MLLPNKRLKLAGRSQVRKNCVASPASLFICGSIALRPRALHPQLKRDPLGGALPPHTVSSVNSFWYGGCTGRRAPDAREARSARRAPPPHGRAIGLPRRAPPSQRRLLRSWLPGRGGSSSCCARGALERWGRARRLTALGAGGAWWSG